MMFAMAIAVFAIFTAPKIVVGACNDFTITFDSVRPGLKGGFIYKYLVADGTKLSSKLSFIEFAIDASLFVDTSDPKIAQSLPGGGGQNGWLKDCPQVSVVTVTPQANQGIIPVEFEVFGSGGQIDDNGLLTKSGNSVDTCVIDGATPGLSPYTSCPEVKKMQLYNGTELVDYCIQIDPRTCCPDPINPFIYECDNTSNVLTKDEAFRLGSEGSEEKPIIIQGFNDDPRCPLGKVEHNPCGWVTLSGVPYGPVCY